MSRLRVGVVGCGKISPAYFTNCRRLGNLEIAACADLSRPAAEEKAAEFHIPRVLSIDEMLTDPSLDAILNLTIPKAHASVNLSALQAGKHVYVEKPFALDRAEAGRVLDMAGSRGLLVGCAPDTFLGAGIQTCRKVIDEGLIGIPHSATSFMICGGHESWHPSPEFYYEKGGGPMFDMGPYYLTALIFLLGPVARVSAMTRTVFPERTITSAPKRGTKIRVEVPTTIFGHLEFSAGAIGSIVTTFDAKGGTTLPRIEIYGTEGTLIVPDPNSFGGPVLMRTSGQNEFAEVPLQFGFGNNSRGVGLSDLARALAAGTDDVRAGGELARHVLDVMISFHEAADQGRTVSLHSSCVQPRPMPGKTQREEVWYEET